MKRFWFWFFIALFIGIALVFMIPAFSQSPQSQTAPLFATNAKYVNGVAPGYMPCGSAALNCPSTTGLNLNVGSGTANCGSGTLIQYAGGNFLLTGSTTNYLYLNTSSSCAPAVKTTAFTGTDIPIAVVVTGSSTITSIVDDRTFFVLPNTSSGGINQLHGDGAAGPGSGDQAFILTTVNGSPGSCGDATHVCQVTTNGKGLVTGQNAVSISAGGIPTILNAGDSITVADDSRSYVDNASSSPITVTAYSSTGTSCTFTTSAQTLSTSSTIQVYGSGWPSGWLTTNNQQIYPVTAATGTSVTILCGQAAGSGSVSGAQLRDATNTWPIQLSKQKSVAAKSVVVESQVSYASPGNTTLSDIITDLGNSVYPNCASGTCYIAVVPTLYDFWSVCSGGESLATYQSNLQTIWTDYHNLGYSVIESSAFPDIAAVISPVVCESQQTFASFANQLNLWLQGQVKNNVVSGSPMSLAYYDYFVDGESAYTDASSQTQLQNSIAHHFSDALHSRIAPLYGQFFATGSSNSRRNTAGATDNAPGLSDQNNFTGSNYYAGMSVDDGPTGGITGGVSVNGVYRGWDSNSNPSRYYVNPSFAITQLGTFGGSVYPQFGIETIFASTTTVGIGTHPQAVRCWSSAQNVASAIHPNLSACDVGIGRKSAGVLAFGNGTSYNDTSASVALTGIFGQATAPSGSCTSGQGGMWQLTADGAITRCPSGGGTWTVFISGGITTNVLTMNNSGSGDASGSMFNGSVGKTISYNSIGAAPLASPSFTGTPAAPTATGGTSTTQLATTAFVQAAIAAAGTGAGIVTYSGPSLSFTGTQYFPIGGGATASTTETNVDIDAPAAVTIQNMTVQMSAAPGAGNSVVYTWRKNASSTVLTCTISGGSATSCSDTTHNFSTASLDLLDIQAVTTGTIVGTPTVVMAAQVGVGVTGSVSQFSGDGALLINSASTGPVIAALGNAAANTIWGNQTGGSTTPAYAKLALPTIATQAADTVDMNASGSTASPTAVAMPTCTGGADLYNTSTHSWSCVAAGGSTTNLCSVVTLTNATCSGGVITVTPGSASATISAIPGTYSNLHFAIKAITSSGSTDQFFQWQFNSDTTTGHYSYAFQQNNGYTSGATQVGGSSSTTAIQACDLSVSTNVGSCIVDIPFYADAKLKGLTSNGYYFSTGNSAYASARWGGEWTQTSAITSITLTPTGSTTITYTTILMTADN